MREIPELTELLAAQQGLASRSQLRGLGLNRDMVRCRLGRNWQAVHPGVVATFTGGLSPHQALIAAQLFAGPSGYLSSWTAAAWHGVQAARVSPVIRLAVPANLAARRSGQAQLVRTTRVDTAVWERGPLRIGSRARAVVDAARDVNGERAAAAIVIEAVQRRLVLAEQLRHELETGPRQGSRKVRRAMVGVEAGAWSLPEANLLDVLDGSTVLPPVWANPALTSINGERLPTPDAWIDEVAVAVQVHSREYHARDADWEGTVSGDTLLGEHGVLVLSFTPARIATHPDEVRRQVERSYLSMLDRPRPSVIATPVQELRSGPPP